MSNLTELLAELATVAPDVCKPGNVFRWQISDCPFSLSSRPNEFYAHIDNNPISGRPAEALLVDALAAECERRGWSYSSE